MERIEGKEVSRKKREIQQENTKILWMKCIICLSDILDNQPYSMLICNLEFLMAGLPAPYSDT